MRKTILMMLAIVLVLTACASTEQQRGKQSANTAKETGNAVSVTISNSAFSPSELKIKAGDAVKWTNNDAAPHSATGQGFDTGELKQGQSKEIVFNKPGTYTYKCGFHPGMKAKISVE